MNKGQQLWVKNSRGNRVAGRFVRIKKRGKKYLGWYIVEIRKSVKLDNGWGFKWVEKTVHPDCVKKYNAKGKDSK